MSFPIEFTQDQLLTISIGQFTQTTNLKLTVLMDGL